MASEQNRYNSTPRKVFDKHVDRMEIRRQRDKEDHRNDLKAIIQTMKLHQIQLDLLAEGQVVLGKLLLPRDREAYENSGTEEL